ncbi:MAG: matrixin family metalloprotease [Phycisphaerales bacterium]|nr:MAG: matrixin family metalloprotease [Phycisphaerales bacterium]
MRNRYLAIWILPLAALTSLASAAWGWEGDWCWPTWVTWDGDPRTGISTVSFPRNSVWRDDVVRSLGRWNDIRGMTFEFDPIVNDTDGVHRLGNGDNEIVFTDNAGTGGALAITQLRLDWCFFGQDIEEADIKFNNSVTWETGAHDPRFEETTASFRFTAVHEMGHFLGLGHEDDRMAALLSTASGFWGGSPSTRTHPFPDDAVGSRTLYPHSNTETDIAISNFRWVSPNNTSLILPSGTQTVSAGDTFTTGFAFGNLGTHSVNNIEVIIVLSTNDIISTVDRVIATGTGWCTPGYYGDHTFTVRVPGNMTPRVYYVGGILDPNNYIAERREGNNRVAFPGTINVTP